MTDAGDLYSPEAADIASGATEAPFSQWQKPIRPKSRLKTLKIVAESYESIRDFEELKVELVDRMCVLLLEKAAS